MSLSPGTTLGPYEILAPIGAGGMGEVYKARDTRLDRTVAIKVLPEHVAADPDLKQRFEREAKTISSLNHPHICTLHDIGSQDGTDFLVMEYLEGDTLAQRLEQGALPIDQALKVATEIADALDKAHRQGIVHRDLKPGNIMLTTAGAKLLDFGLAKLRKPGTIGAEGYSATTESAPLTARGSLLGTLPYMAPEQLEGKEADHRTDIFAFGALVYEMVTGRRAFAGDSQASLIGAILKDDPPLVSTLQAMTPLTLDRVLKKCLAKDPDGRWQTVYDLHDELTWITESDALFGGSTAPPASQGRSGTTAAPWILVSVVSASIGLAIAAWGLSQSPPPVGPAARLNVSLSPADRLYSNLQVAVSRDGAQLAYVGVRDDERRLYYRDLTVEAARPVRGSIDAERPFFSPDGEWIGFFAAGSLQIVPVGGGTPVKLAEAPGPRGGSWSEDDVIVFAPLPRAGLSRVSADGGTAEPLTVLDVGRGETAHRQPRFLPGGKAVVFMAEDTNRKSWVIVLSLETGERHVLVEDATHPRYSASGHLLYRQGDATMAAPFDLARQELLGPGVPVLPNEATLLTLSDTGTLVYLADALSDEARELVWVTRDGQEEPLAAPARKYSHPQLSPDGRRVAVEVDEPGSRNIWLYDIGQETPLTPLTFNGGYGWPVWTRDGVHVTYASNRLDTGWDVHWTRADGSAADEVLWGPALLQAPRSWAPDGQTLVFRQVDPSSGHDIWLFTLAGNTSRPWLETAAMESFPALSPNGQWVAYVSDESGPREVYVRPLSGNGQWLVSTDGGVEPVWSRDSRELFYWKGDQLYAVRIGSGETFQHGTPMLLFERAHRAGTFSPGYDVDPAGQRFLIVERQSAVSQLDLIMNWFDELQRLVPTP